MCCVEIEQRIRILLVAVIIGESDMHESLSLLLSLFVSCDVMAGDCHVNWC